MASMNDKEWQDWTDKFLALGKSHNVVPMTKEQSSAFISMSYAIVTGQQIGRAHV